MAVMDLSSSAFAWFPAPPLHSSYGRLLWFPPLTGASHGERLSRGGPLTPGLRAAHAPSVASPRAKHAAACSCSRPLSLSAHAAALSPPYQPSLRGAPARYRSPPHFGDVMWCKDPGVRHDIRSAALHSDLPSQIGMREAGTAGGGAACPALVPHRRACACCGVPA
eukprot:CAMPEP_0113709768 /NCGR_PEP_ID=MMETSP0038_2-20120614/29765_1 /TAXON_ID=2898 /ORGANISM="Cryptomonas paramecium" /LENGTH=165 /DNA_ID=CAMNT_0000635711 /DNA_START=56 /DNA_END=551 /DNA_ORIENTATION=+ /assembly_acc=CAM_ASM_000170